eukprot:4632598-Amphidinium_carterae.1
MAASSATTHEAMTEPSTLLESSGLSRQHACNNMLHLTLECAMGSDGIHYWQVAVLGSWACTAKLLGKSRNSLLGHCAPALSAE